MSPQPCLVGINILLDKTPNLGTGYPRRRWGADHLCDYLSHGMSENALCFPAQNKMGIRQPSEVFDNCINNFKLWTIIFAHCIVSGPSVTTAMPSRAVLRRRFVVSSAYPAVDASCSVTVAPDVSDR